MARSPSRPSICPRSAGSRSLRCIGVPLNDRRLWNGFYRRGRTAPPAHVAQPHHGPFDEVVRDGCQNDRAEYAHDQDREVVECQRTAIDEVVITVDNDELPEKDAVRNPAEE